MATKATKATSKAVEVNTSGRYFAAVGRRKTSTANVRLYENGSGQVVVDGKALATFADVPLFSEKIKAPLRLFELQNTFDIVVAVDGGGKSGQTDAINHGVSRALLEYDPLLRKELKAAGFLTRDPRRVERKKPGLRKARRSPQWSKR